MNSNQENKMVANKGEGRKRRRDETTEAVVECQKKTKVHAQRKFAQGSALSSPAMTPIKDKDKGKPSTAASTQEQLLSAKRPNTEDFITFLCFRRTSILPPELDFFKEGCPTETPPPGQSTRQSTSSRASGSVVSPLTPPTRSGAEGKKKPGAQTVLALRKKYQEQRLAKQKSTTVTKLAQKVKGKNMMRSRTALKEEPPAVSQQPQPATARKTALSSLRSGHMRHLAAVKKPAKPGVLRKGLRSGKPVAAKSPVVPALKKQVEIKLKPVRFKRTDKLEGLSDFSSDDNEPLLGKRVKFLPKKAVVKAAKGPNTARTRSAGLDTAGTASTRPSRKTKEAAAVYMEMLTKKLVSPEKSGDEDRSSVESFPELPNAKRTEQIELRAKAFRRKIVKPSGSKTPAVEEVKKTLRKKVIEPKKVEEIKEKKVGKRVSAVPKEEEKKKRKEAIKPKEESRRSQREAEATPSRPATRSKSLDVAVVDKPTPPPKKMPKKATLLLPKRLNQTLAKRTTRMAIRTLTAKRNTRALARAKKPPPPQAKARLKQDTGKKKAESAKAEVKTKGSKPNIMTPKAEKSEVVEKEKKADVEPELPSRRPLRKCSTMDKIWIDLDGFTSDEDDFVDEKPVTKKEKVATRVAEECSSSKEIKKETKPSQRNEIPTGSETSAKVDSSKGKDEGKVKPCKEVTEGKVNIKSGKKEISVKPDKAASKTELSSAVEGVKVDKDKDKDTAKLLTIPSETKPKVAAQPESSKSISVCLPLAAEMKLLEPTVAKKESLIKTESKKEVVVGNEQKEVPKVMEMANKRDVKTNEKSKEIKTESVKVEEIAKKEEIVKRESHRAELGQTLTSLTKPSGTVNETPLVTKSGRERSKEAEDKKPNLLEDKQKTLLEIFEGTTDTGIFAPTMKPPTLSVQSSTTNKSIAQVPARRNIADTLLEKMKRTKEKKAAVAIVEETKKTDSKPRGRPKSLVESSEKQPKRVKRNQRQCKNIKKYDADRKTTEPKRQRPVRQCSTGEKLWIESDSEFDNSSEEDEHFLNQIIMQSVNKKEKEAEMIAKKHVKRIEEDEEEEESEEDKSNDSYFSASDEEPLQKIVVEKRKSDKREKVSEVENITMPRTSVDMPPTAVVQQEEEVLPKKIEGNTLPVQPQPPPQLTYTPLPPPPLHYICSFPPRGSGSREPINTHGLDLLSEVAPLTLGRDVSSNDKMQTERIEKWLKESQAAERKGYPVYDDVERERPLTDFPPKFTVSVFPNLSQNPVKAPDPIPRPLETLVTHVTSEPQKKLAVRPEVRSTEHSTPKKTLTSVQDLLKLQKERRESPKPMLHDNTPHAKNCKCNSCVVRKGWFKNKPKPPVEETSRQKDSQPFESLAKAFNQDSEVKNAKVSASVAPLMHAASQSSPEKQASDRKPIFPQRKLSFLERMKERERKEAAAAANPKAFSPNNESSVYAFEPEPEQSAISSPPFRSKTRDSRTSSTATSRSEEDVLRICEDEVSQVSSGTQVDRKPPPTCKPFQSTSIAVQVNLDSETIAPPETSPELPDGKCNEISTQTEVPEDDSDSHMFYIPLQQSNSSPASEQQLIQGVALKLGTEGPMGPNQRVIMKAKLVTKSADTPAIKGVVMPQPKRLFDKSQKSPPVGTVQPTTRKPPATDTAVQSQPNNAETSSAENLEAKNTKVSPKSQRKCKPDVDAAGSSKAKRAVKQNTSDTQPPRAASPAELVEAPIFYPTEKEFHDPMEYLEKIRPAAEQFGICRIVPPSTFKPDCKVSDDMRFTAYNQYVSRMLQRWGPNVKEMMAIKRYLATQSISLKQPPWIGGIEVDLPRLYQAVQSCGGLMKVMEKKKWAQVADVMRIPKAAQDRVTKLDDIYCKYLLPYDTLSHDERQKLLEEVEKDWQERQEQQPSDDTSEEEETYIDECDECIVKGRNVALNQFYRVARNTLSMWFKAPEPTPAEVESEFWRHVQERNHHVCVNSGSIDSSGWGYGFPTAKNNSFSKHPWNLKVLTNNSNSVLRSLGPVMGVTVPTLHVGMVFTAFCWYRDPHGLPWIEYLHTGAPKIWYGISDEKSHVFREAVTELLPRHVKAKTIWLPSDTAMVPPPLLVDHGVSLCRTVQQPGQFVVVFPRAFISSICTGYSVSESVYFTNSNWLATAEQVFKDIQDSCEPTMFSLEKLLFNIATDTRTPVEVLKQVLPMVWHVRQAELDCRKTLFNLGLKSSERLPVREEGGKKRKGRWAVEEEGDYECEVCRANLFVSLVSNSHEQGVYCLRHAIDLLTTKRQQLKYCKLLYEYSQEEMNELVEKLEQRIETKSQKKPTTKPTLSATAVKN